MERPIIMKRARSLLAGAAALSLATLFSAAAADGGRLAPIADVDSTSRHAPYEMGQCDICHDAARGAAPGAVRKVGNELCFDCHDEFKKRVRGHPATDKSGCVACHSPHNSKKKKLLL
jgi:predicted CXXCH cytochrome family protein